jgi:glutathione S-transferase
MAYVLAIGDRAYSSWSLRGWLPFAAFAIPVTLRFCRLYTPEFSATLAEGFGPARTVPALRIEDRAGDLVLWDSLAIAETLAERHPDLPLWPEPPAARAMARALAAEMHGGFTALRTACPMNLRRSYAGFAPDAAVRADLARIEALWSAARARHGGAGPWLFGAYSLADVFFAPVATRVATYGLPMGSAAMAYVEAHLADPAFRAWRAEALADPVIQAIYELDLPQRPWPGPA